VTQILPPVSDLTTRRRAFGRAQESQNFFEHVHCKNPLPRTREKRVAIALRCNAPDMDGGDGGVRLTASRDSELRVGFASSISAMRSRSWQIQGLLRVGALGVPPVGDIA
jgi:hypothetical protein